MDKNTFMLLEAVLNMPTDLDKIKGLRYLKKANRALYKEIHRLEILKVKHGLHPQAA